MRLLVLPLLLTALPTAAAAPPAPRPAAPPVDPTAIRAAEECRRGDLHRADTPAPAAPRRLGELPPGDTLLAVYRQVDGCMEPVIVRYGDGRAPEADAAPPEPARPRARIWR